MNKITRPSMVPEGQEPWQWADPVWRTIVDKVRAGRSLKPKSWPGGARCAVALSFDSDHETGTLREGQTSPGRLSQGQFGSCTTCDDHRHTQRLAPGLVDQQVILVRGLGDAIQFCNITLEPQLPRAELGLDDLRGRARAARRAGQ